MPSSAAPTVTVRPATPDEVPALARVVSEAFFDEPVGVHLNPNPATRFERGVRFFGDVSMRKLSLPYGGTYTTTDHTGVAIWVPPGTGELTKLEQLRLLAYMARVSRIDVLKAVRFLAAT